MAILQSCCYWKTVRKGSFASAIYTLIYFGFSSVILLIYVHDEKDYLTGARERPVGESMLERGNVTITTVIFNVIFLCCSLLLVLSSLLVILGLQHNKRELLLPWIAFMLCDVLIELAHLVYLSITQRVIFDPVVGFLFTMDFFIMCLNFYCLVCVISQYQEFSNGREHEAVEMRDSTPLQNTSNANILKSKTSFVERTFFKSKQLHHIRPNTEEQQQSVFDKGMEESSTKSLETTQEPNKPDQLNIPIIMLDPNSSL